MQSKVEINSQITVEQAWAELEAQVASKSLRLQRQEEINSHLAWATDGPTVYFCRLYKAGKEPLGWDQAAKDQNAADLTLLLAADSGKPEALSSKPETLIGVQGSWLDGCETPEIAPQGPSPSHAWARASFPLAESAHVAFAHPQPFQCILGDMGQTVVIVPQSRHELAGVVVQGSDRIPVGGAADYYGNSSYVCEYVEVWDGAGDTAALLMALRIAGVSGSDVLLVGTTPQEIPAGAQVVGILKAYHKIRGPLGTDGGARFVGTVGTKLGNPGEMSALVPKGFEIGIRFRAKAKAGRLGAGLAVTIMNREPKQ